MATMDGSVMVDTNVLVYAAIEDAPFHATAASAICRCVREGADFWISRQILREFVACLTRPQLFAPLPSRSAVLQQAREWESRALVAEDSAHVTEILFDLLDRFPVGGKQVHDANIVATMLAHGISTLLTNNPADFRRFSRTITLRPLVDEV